MKKRVMGILALGALFCLTGASNVIATQVGHIKENEAFNLAKQNGYEEANAIYRQAEINKLNEQLSAEEITQQEYDSKVESIGDLSVDYYVSGDSVSAQVQEEYATLKGSQMACRISTWALSGFMAGEAVATFLYIRDSKHSEFREEETYMNLNDIDDDEFTPLSPYEIYMNSKNETTSEN